MAKWWEVYPAPPTAPADPTPKRGLARVLDTQDPAFFATQQAADDAEFAQRHEAMSQSERALAQSDAQLRAVVPAVRGLYRSLTGNEAQGQEDLRRAKDIMDREAAYAPDIQSLEDVHGPGDALAYGRNAVLSNLPTVIPTLAAAVGTGGASAVAGAGLRGLAERGLANAVGRALTYRTGQAAGALAGSSALQSTQVLDAATDASGGDSARSRAAKAVVGAVTTGALDALPEISLLNRLGLGGAAKRAIAPELSRTLGQRLASEAGKQALQEGTTEAIQSLGENLTHKWVNDNVEVLGPKAYMEYLNSFVAGGLVGGALGSTAGIRDRSAATATNETPGAPARERVRDAFKWFNQKDLTPRPATEFDQQPAAPANRPAPAPAPEATAPEDLTQTLKQATTAVVSEGTSKLGGFVGKLFGKYHAEFKDEDFNTDFDSLLKQFQAIDRNGEATSDENGIIGRTHEDGLVRGGVPYNGFSLFNPDQAESIWSTARQSNKPISTFQAFALSALDPTQVEGLGKEPVKAAALYLATGDRSAVNEDHLAAYLKALPSSDAQIQFLFAADRVSDMVKRGREAAGGPVELTPKDVRKMVDTSTDPLRTTVDAEDKSNFDLRTTLSDNPDGEGSFADFQQQQSMDEERAAPVALHETISAKDFSKMSFGDQAPDATRGEIAATNSKGKHRTVKLASLVARGWQEVRNGTFDAPNGVVDVVAQAIDTIRQKGMNVSPEAIKPGLWLGGETRLTPAEAKAIRQGMQVTEAKRAPVQETPGLPNVPPGDRPFDASTLDAPTDQVQGEDGVENMTGDEAAALRPRTRSPQGLRIDVQDEGQSAAPVMVAQKTNPKTGAVYQKFAPEQVTRPAKVSLREAETLDTQSADNISDDQRRAENDAIEALHRANAVLKPGTTLKGRSLQQLMENFGKRVKSLKTPTKAQRNAIDGARRAIQRVERNTDTGERSGTVTDPAEPARKILAIRAKENAATAVAEPKNSAPEHSDEVVQNGLDNEGFAQWKEQLAKQPADTYKPEFATRMSPQEMREELAAVNRNIERDSARGMLQTGLFYERAELEHMLGTKNTKPRFDLDFSVDDLIEDGKTLGNIQREQVMLDALTQRLGIKPIKLEAMPFGQRGFGIYYPNSRTIRLSNLRQGNARLDTMLHELGHAVVVDTYDTLSAVDKKALDAAYQDWLRTNYGDGTELGVRKSRAPFFLKKWLDENRKGEGKALTDLTDEQIGYVLSFDEFLADHLARALGKHPETQGIIGKFFTALAEKLRELYQIFSGHDYEPAESAERWVDSLLRGQMAQVINAQSIERQQALADADLPADPPPTQPQQSSGGAQPSQLFYLLNKTDRALLEKTLRAPKIYEQVYQAANPSQQRQLDLNGPDMVVLIDLAAALHAQGKLSLGAATPLGKLVSMAKRMLGLPSNEDVAKQIYADFAADQIRRGRYDGEAKAFNRNEYTRTVQAVQRGIRTTVQPAFDRFTLDVGSRMRQSMVPALRKAATLFETRVGENAGEESFVSARQQFFSLHATKYMEAIGKLKDQDKRTLARALQTNERPEGDLGTAFDRMRTFYNQLYSWSRKHGVDLQFRRDYFPIVMDSKRVEDNWEEMRSLFEKPEYEEDIRSFFKDNKTSMRDLTDRLVQIAQTADTSHVGEVEFALGLYEPAMNAQRAQIMGFLSRTDRKQLAKYQVDSLDAITLGYINQLSKKAAFVKTFGKVGYDQYGQPKANRLGMLRAAAQRQGATAKDIQLFDDFAKMMLGSYHAELNPTIRWVFSKVDKIFDKDLEDMSIEEWAHYQQVAMTYNNLRLLGLAPLSSLIDSLGTIARGGNIADATKSIWDGIKAMRANGGELRDMAQDLGIIEKHALSDALAATYGGQFDPQGKLGRLNNALFKYNGLEAITRHSRLAALAMGHRFLLRNALHPTAHSERLLKELQLTAADVQPDPNNPRFVKLTPKTEAALRRFVTESVVRPQPSQRPGWHNDPNFQFAAQYKGYLYAFYTTIVHRMMHEAQQGNYAQAVAPLIPYLGVTVVAEMIRYAIQHPGEDDPRDAEAYMKLAATRSGLVGPRFGVFHDARTDNRYGSWVTNSWIGPTGQQVTDLVDTAIGKRSFGRTAVEALPGSAIFEDWTFGGSASDAADAAK